MEHFLKSIPLWFELTGFVFCMGCLACLLWVFPVKNNAEGHEWIRPRERVWLSFGIALGAAVTGSAVDLLFRTAEMSGHTILSAFLLIPTVVLETHAGRVWIVRMASCLLLMVMMKTGRTYRDSYPYLRMMICLVALIALTESASGHAADKGDFTMAEIMDWAHLAGAMVWAGGLFVLASIVLPFLASTGGQSARSLAEVAARFSGIAGIAVGVVCLTSLYNAWAYVGSVGALVSSGYGRTVMIKIGLLALLLIIAGFNRSVSVPRLQERAGQTNPRQDLWGRLVSPVFLPFARNLNGDRTARWFNISVRIEAILILGILLCAASLRHEIPARHALHTKGNGTGLHEHMHP